MASRTDITRLQRIAPQGDFTDAELSALIDAKGINGAAADLWGAQTSATASLVDVTESGSSRKNSQAHDKAKEMLEYYAGIYAGEQAALLNPGRTARSRPMRR
jgi:hypothetical protein